MTHPLNVQDEQARASALAEIKAGLDGPEDDRWYWANKASQRARCLRDDRETFGLVPHEETELAALDALLEAKS